jgi:hypothetical protein
MKSLLLGTGLILLFLFIFASVACTSSPKFSQGDIDKTEMAIRADFAKRGFTVEEVSLIKESDRLCATVQSRLYLLCYLKGYG